MGSSVGSLVLGSRRLQFNQLHQPFEIVGDRFERQFQLVFCQSQIPHSPVSLPVFPVGKDALNVPPHLTLPVVGRLVARREVDVMRFLFQNPVADAVRPQPCAVGFAIIRLVRIHGTRVGGRDLM